MLLYVQDILSTSASRPIQNPVSAPANPGTRHNIPQRAYSSSHIQNHYQRLHEGSEQSMPEPSSNGSDERDGGRQERIDDVRSQQPHVAEKRPVSVERIDPVVSWLLRAELETEGFYLLSIQVEIIFSSDNIKLFRTDSSLNIQINLSPCWRFPSIFATI